MDSRQLRSARVSSLTKLFLKMIFFSGMCALFSTSCLVLTWWPLLRDCTFYSTSLVTLVLFFTDQEIPWYESATLLGIYGSYVFFMKFNAQAEVAFKKLIGASKISPDKGVSLGRGQKATGHRVNKFIFVVMYSSKYNYSIETE